jgi:transcription termination/antitermination protein NusA
MSVDFEALIALTAARQIPLEKMISFIENAVTEHYRELPEAKPQGRAVLNRDTGKISIQVPLFDEAGIYTETIVDEPEGFERLVQSIVRKEIKQRMRAQNDAGIVEEFSANVGDVISGMIQQGRDPAIVYVDLGKVEGKIPPNEQVAGESYNHGDRIKCFVVDVKQGLKGPEVTLSRSHPLLVKQLFMLEVPELKERIVEIVGVAREAGFRTKVSVRSHRAGVSPKGALIGPSGARSKAVSEELNGEKIDIVDFSENPAIYVANALAPAKVSSCEVVDLETKSAKVIVPDYQLSLAIGKDGQNARLAARLTSWRIDIHPDNPVERIFKPKPVKEEQVLEPSENSISEGENPA